MPDMKQALFRFYAELNDFLPQARRGKAFVHRFWGNPNVKDVIESLGVPHGEVDLVLADGASVDFLWTLHDGARVSVYPVFESLDITPVLRLRPAPLRVTRFVLDAHLGRLASYLRMLGFDTWWRNDFQDEELAWISQQQERILLTRDVGLLKRSAVSHGYWVRHTRAREQVVEVLKRFDLMRAVAAFQRCLCCNSLLEPVSGASVRDRLPAKVRELHSEFRACPDCGRLYWKGSHYRHMSQFIAALTAKTPLPPPSPLPLGEGKGN